MSLTRRKGRPLKRDSDSLRDDRLFIIACDDKYAPKQYFDFFKISRIQVHVVPTEDGTSSADWVLDRLLEYDHDEDDELWILLDTDHNIEKNHIKSYMAALTRARQNNVSIALSRPCFETWLLLHHVNSKNIKEIANATEASDLLRDALGEYNKTRLKKGHYSLEKVVYACKQAEKLDKNDNGGEIPSINNSRVYKIWKTIIEKALSSQLPDELKVLSNNEN